MESSAKIREWAQSLSESLNDQVWFQELKTKWEELDPQSRAYLKIGLASLTLLVLLFWTLSFIWSVHSLKKELSEKTNLLQIIQSAQNELRKSKDSLPSGATLEGLAGGISSEREVAWPAYFESLAGTSGIDPASLSVTGEKTGTPSDQTKETLLDVNLKHVNIKQVVRYVFSIENGQRPVKLRNLLIDTKNDPTGYLDATLSVSAFTPLGHK